MNIEETSKIEQQRLEQQNQEKTSFQDNIDLAKSQLTSEDQKVEQEEPEQKPEEKSLSAKEIVTEVRNQINQNSETQDQAKKDKDNKEEKETREFSPPPFPSSGLFSGTQVFEAKEEAKNQIIERGNSLSPHIETSDNSDDDNTNDNSDDDDDEKKSEEREKLSASEKLQKFREEIQKKLKISN